MKIGIALDGEYLGQGNPIDDYDSSQVTEVIHAVIDWLNETGGLAGRQVEPVIKLVPAFGSVAANTEEHERVCVEFTEDDDVFMVISAPYSTVFAAACYAKHQTPLMHTSSLYREADYERLEPWLLPDQNPTLSSIARLLPRALAEQGFLSDPSHRLGVVSWDFELMEDTAKNILVPELERLGANVEAVAFPRKPQDQQGDAATWATALEFQQLGIDRVVLWDHGGGTRAFLAAAETQGYRPRYGLSSLNGGEARMHGSDALPVEQMHGAVGAGWAPGNDVPDELFPLTARERWCLGVVNQRLGTDYAARSTVDSTSFQSTVAMSACTYALLLRDALAPATGKPLAAADLLGLIQDVGKWRGSLLPPRPVFGPGLGGGGSAYALMRFVSRTDACQTRSGGCFQYVRRRGDSSIWRPIPR